jgi:hypothetical protein
MLRFRTLDRSRRSDAAAVLQYLPPLYSGTYEVRGKPHGFDAVYWDPEFAWKIQSAAGAAHSKTWRKRP